jgi:hypothetical protein
MKRPSFDHDGYPTCETLNTIAKWDWQKYGWLALVDYVEEAWHPCGFVARGRKYLTLVTGGWSGNESIIGALEMSFCFPCFWEASYRGGKHVYNLAEMRRLDAEKEITS